MLAYTHKSTELYAGCLSPRYGHGGYWCCWFGQFGFQTGDSGQNRTTKSALVRTGHHILFVGTFERKLDSSNRFRLPKEILRELKPEMVERLHCLSISGECLLVFPPKSFQKIMGQFSNLEISNPQQRQMARDLFANIENCRLDGAGRMMLPIHSRACAGICSAIVLIGAGKYFEIWAKEKFHALHREETGKTLRQLLRGDGLAI